VAAGEWFTRGFHLDGFSDCLDGLLVNGDAARRLQVMKDPHVGGLGAAGVALWMLLRVAAVYALVDSGWVVWGLLAGPVFARALLAADMALFPAASSSGLYATIRGAIRPPDAVIALVWLLLGASALIYAVPIRGAVAVIGVLAMPLFWHRMWVQRLGGINGDVLGASVQLRELWVQACLG
jgi:adenosylcobinamide-GDP ribazoletransferase